MTSEISINKAQNSSFYIKNFSVHLHAHSDSDQELAHSMQARSSLLLVFINKNILEHSHSCLFHHYVPAGVVSVLRQGYGKGRSKNITLFGVFLQQENNSILRSPRRLPLLSHRPVLDCTITLRGQRVYGVSIFIGACCHTKTKLSF